MAIRVNSNTPQQQQASADSFGYIRSFRSPLEGVKVADMGAGLQQAGQAAQNVAAHMKRKEDAAGRIVADAAYNQYSSEVDAVNNNLTNAYAKGNQQEIDTYTAQFNALDPSLKTFDLSNYSEGKVDSQYYAPYTGGLSKNWGRLNTKHGNTKHQYTITNTLDGLELNGDTSTANFRLQQNISPEGYMTQLSKIIIAGNNPAIESVTTEAKKSGYRASMSSNARAVFSEQVRRATNLDEAEAVRTNMLTLLGEENGLATFMTDTDQRAVETLVNSALAKMSDPNSSFLDDQAALNLKGAQTVYKQISNSVNSFNNNDLNNSLNQLELSWENTDTSKLNVTGQLSHKSLGKLISQFKPVNIEDENGNVVAVDTPISIDVKATLKNPQYVVDVDEDLTADDAAGYRALVARIAENGRDAFNNGGGTDALKIILGSKYKAATARDDAAALGYSTTPLINLPSGDVPDFTTDPIAFKTWVKDLYDSNPENPAALAHYGAFLRNRSGTTATQSHTGYLVEMLSNRSLTGADPLTLAENSIMFSTKYNTGSGNFTDKEEEEWGRFLEKANKEDTHELPVLREIRYANEAGDTARANFYSTLLKGTWVDNYRKLTAKSGAPNLDFLLNKRGEIYNATFTFDAEQLSASNGFIGNTDDASGLGGLFSTSGHIPVRIPATWSENINYRISLLGGFQGTKRIVGGTDTFQYFMSNFGEKRHVIDNMARDTAAIGLHYAVIDGDIDYKNFSQKLGESGYKNQFLDLITDYGDNIDLGRLSNLQLVKILSELKVTDNSGIPRSAVIMMDDGEAADGSLGRVIGIWNKDQNMHTQLVYEDGRRAIVPHSHFNDKLDVVARTFRLESLVDSDESSRVRNREVLPFYSLSVAAQFMFLEKDRLGDDWDYDKYKEEQTDSTNAIIEAMPIVPIL